MEVVENDIIETMDMKENFTPINLIDNNYKNKVAF